MDDYVAPFLTLLPLHPRIFHQAMQDIRPERNHNLGGIEHSIQISNLRYQRMQQFHIHLLIRHPVSIQIINDDIVLRLRIGKAMFLE